MDETKKIVVSELNNNDLQNNINIITNALSIFETQINNNYDSDNINNNIVNNDITNNIVNNDVIIDIVNNDITNNIVNNDFIIDIVNNDNDDNNDNNDNDNDNDDNNDNDNDDVNNDIVNNDVIIDIVNNDDNDNDDNDDNDNDDNDIVNNDDDDNDDNKLQKITNHIYNFNKEKLEIPSKVTFTNISLNDITEINKFNNPLNMSSTQSNSEFSYTKNINSIHKYNSSNNFIKKNIKLNNIKTKHISKQDETDDLDYLYNKLQDYCRYMIINRKNYIIVICKAIEIIENYKDIKKNIHKKDLVIKAINRLIVLDLHLCVFDKKIFILTISNLIDLIINFTKIKINQNDKNQNNTINELILAKPGQIVCSLVDKLTTIIIKKNYCLDKIFINIGTVINIVMILVDKYNYLPGVEKKIIVLQVIDNFIKEKIQCIFEITEDKREEFILLLDTVQITIDLFITLKKGKYNINIQNEVYYTHKLIKNNTFGCFKTFNKKQQFVDETY